MTEYDEMKMEQSSNIVKSGYLDKESFYLRNLKKRWIVLKHHCLYSYKTQNTHQNPTEIIDLRKFNAVQYITREKEAKSFCFAIFSASGAPYRKFIASSLEEMTDWMYHIRQEFRTHCDILTAIASSDKNAKILKLPIQFKPNSWKRNDPFIKQCVVGISYSKEQKLTI